MKRDELYHHGIKGQKWGVKNGPPYPLKQRSASNQKMSKQEVSKISQRIRDEVVKYKNGGPAGNQNCQLCTWSMEMQFRGENVLPRPVYSPRDIEFTVNGYDIVQNPQKIHIKNKQDIINTVNEAGNGSRFYTHVNWKGSSGGHEFIIANIDNEINIIDAQAGLVAPITSRKGSYYTTGINYDNSFIVRTDNKPINRDILKYNDKKYITEWDFKKDAKYMLEHDMLSDEDIQYLKNLNIL